ncbi:MAG: hypothetical protein K0R90_227 [Oscillospiraceae bacterium]|jgi:hypothetical protein|nr:hypothetical protein [Oscillospiraceae bacterium]
MQENMNNNGSEQTPNVVSTKKAKRFNKTVLLGSIVLAFAVIGIIFSVVFVSRFTYDIIDNKSAKAEFEHFIYPLVMLDPPPFERVDKLDQTIILTAACWNLIQTEDTSKYEKDEFGFITVPKSDIEAHATKLFGTGLKFKHQSIGDAEIAFEYNEDTGEYVIPSTSIFPPYTPKVEKIEKKDDTYKLQVGYIPTGDLWRGDVNGKKYEPKPTKELEYILQKNGKSYKIISVRDKNSTIQPSVSSDLESEVTSGMESLAESPLSSDAKTTSQASSAPASSK